MRYILDKDPQTLKITVILKLYEVEDFHFPSPSMATSFSLMYACPCRVYSTKQYHLNI